MGERLASTTASMARRARSYSFSDAPRSIQSLLGLLWVLAGALQFQSFMYGKGFIALLTGMAPAQPHWLAGSLLWGAHIMQQHQGPYNTFMALIQIGIGLGILYRPTVKQALIVSFVWALAVWWFGEAFGMLFMNTASPLTGAPGAVLLYALVGAMVWPNGRPGGLLGVNGARVVWASLWLLMAALWLMAVNSSANATYGLIKSAPAGAGWLASVQHAVMDASRGNGLVIAIVLAAVSALVGLAVAFSWRPRAFLSLAVGLNLVYWVVGQGLGGILEGRATDPNAGPVFILMSVALYALVPYPARVRGRVVAPAAGRVAAPVAGRVAASTDAQSVATVAGWQRARRGSSGRSPARPRFPAERLRPRPRFPHGRDW
ncbi:MAG TPA: hypothetical protein VG275_03555 [Solirubrobacteraceae bacterium]|nr:hypothetical protein [Solirubrobacteraceae bacterium]